MKTTSSPESYRYCTSFTSVCTRGNFSPARNVLSTTAPESRLRSRERTKAPPFPGFTCWNSRMRQTEPSISMCIPFLNWFVLTVSAIAAASLVDGHQVLGEARKDLGPVVSDDDEVFDSNASLAGQVDPRLDGDDVSGGERVLRGLAETRRLMYLDPETVSKTVAEPLAEAGLVDKRTRRRVGVDPGSPCANRLESRLLRMVGDCVDLLEPLRQLAGRERPGAVGRVAVDGGGRVHDNCLSRTDHAVARTVVRQGGVGAAGDDDLEGRPLRALRVEELLQPPGDLALRAAGEARPRDSTERLARCPRPSADRVELALALDRPQCFDETASRHEVETAARKGLVLGIGNGHVLEADASLERLGQRHVEIAVALNELDTLALERFAGRRVAEVAVDSKA